MIIFTSPINKEEANDIYFNPFSKLLTKEEIELIEKEITKYPIFSSGSIYSGCKVLFWNLLSLKYNIKEVIFNPFFDPREFLSIYDYFRYSFYYNFRVRIVRTKNKSYGRGKKVPLPFFNDIKVLTEFYYSIFNMDDKSFLKFFNGNQVPGTKILITGDFLISYEILKYLINKGFYVSILNNNRFFLNKSGIHPVINDCFYEIKLVPPFSHVLKEKDENYKLILESYYPGYLTENDKIRVENFLKSI